MILYFTDSKGYRKKIAEDLKTAEECINAIIKDQQSRFIYSSGKLTLQFEADDKYAYAATDNKRNGYVIEM